MAVPGIGPRTVAGVGINNKSTTIGVINKPTIMPYFMRLQSAPTATNGLHTIKKISDKNTKPAIQTGMFQGGTGRSRTKFASKEYAAPLTQNQNVANINWLMLN
jgi:hypothetical protein